MSDLLPEKWMKAVAITTTVFAVVAAIAGSRAAYYIAKAQLLTAMEGSKWAYYQAKSIKENLLDAQKKNFQIQRLGALSTEQSAFVDKELAGYEANIKRYEQEKNEIKSDAEATARENALVVRRGSQFSLAVVFSQIGIMLSSVSALLKRKELWIVGLIIGSISLVFVANGQFLFLPF